MLLSLLACREETKADRDLTLLSAALDRTGGLALVVTGRELPAAATCELELTGTAYRPAMQHGAVHEVLPCRVIDREQLFAALDDSSLRSLAPVLFEGTLRVRLARAARERPFARGRLQPVAFRVAGESARELALLRAAQGFQEALGMRELELTSSGLALVALAADGPAARAGLAVGDIIERVNGAPVELVSDFVVDSQTAVVELSVVRQLGQQRQRFKRQVVLAGHAHAPPWNALLMLGLLSGALLPALHVPAKPRKLTHRAVGLLAMLAILAACNALSLPVDLGALWMVPVLLRLFVLARAYGGRALSSTALSNEALALAMASLGASAFALGAGGASEPVLPWQWPIFVAPPAWLAAWVLARSQSGAERAPPMPGDRLTPISVSIIDYARAAVLAWFALGAVGVPGWLDSERLGPLAVGLLFILKLELARWLLTKLQSVASSEWVALAAAVCAPLFSLASREFVPSDTHFAPALGTLLCGFLAGRAARTAYARVARTWRRHDPVLAPFP